MTLSLVGPVVGEVSALPSGAGSTLSDNGAGYDVAIGGLGFKLKIGDETPYERATAQFKKDQFDSASNVGDQSLLGYWTRGQLSFHKGSGIRYYEPTDDTVLNRYREGQGVEPFAELGEVALKQEWTNTTTNNPFSTIVWGGAGDGFLAVQNSTQLDYATSLTGATTTYTPTAGTVNVSTVGGLCAYVGTSANKIERVGIGAGAPASGALYTHSTGFLGLWFAKDRLFALDQNGVLYHLSPDPAGAPVAIGAGDIVFTARGRWGSSIWQLVDTPGPVLLSNGPNIYAVTVATDGAVPTLAAPIQVAQLPTGESVSGMAYSLGFLVLRTSAGIRVGIVSESGQVTYGPLLVEWSSAQVSYTTLAARGSSVFVGGEAKLYEVNLSQQIGDGLEFGVAQLADPYGDVASATTFGVFTWAGTTLVAWSSKALGAVPRGSLKHESSNLASSGYLTTGYHRYGTLEPKQFQSVRVRVGGTGGTVAVSRIMADGSEIPLYTFTIGVSSTDDEIALGLSTPIEMVALKFTLTRDGTDATKGPILYGYQLRALPAPKRQRMIRLPLMLMDVERRGVTRANGYEGSAWDRLSALEDMEQSGGVFQFQDFRTGEAGTVYIESIEHRGLTPPGKGNDGFGGTVFLTLRKL